MLQIISWLLTAIALYGTWLNAKLDRRGFWWWIVSDLGLAAIFVHEGMYAQASLFAIYTILAIMGLVKWK